MLIELWEEEFSLLSWKIIGTSEFDPKNISLKRKKKIWCCAVWCQSLAEAREGPSCPVMMMNFAALLHPLLALIPSKTLTLKFVCQLARWAPTAVVSFDNRDVQLLAETGRARHLHQSGSCWFSSEEGPHGRPAAWPSVTERMRGRAWSGNPPVQWLCRERGDNDFLSRVNGRRGE